jgi:hypothetical protein
VERECQAKARAEAEEAAFTRQAEGRDPFEPEETDAQPEEVVTGRFGLRKVGGDVLELTLTGTLEFIGECLEEEALGVLGAAVAAALARAR